MTSSDILAGIAVVISLLSLGFSIWTTLEQRRQWRATSLGRVELTSVEFIYWRTYSEEELANIRWGYNVDLMPLLDENRVSKNYGLPARLVAYDPEQKRTYPETTALTHEEFRLRINNSALPKSVIPVKELQLQWHFQNVGATAIRDFIIAVDNKLPESGVWEEGSWGQPIELGPGRTGFKLTSLFSDLELHIPEKLLFRLRFEYTNIDNERISRTLPVYFQSRTGVFYLGE
jgi:hypothetical protein